MLDDIGLGNAIANLIYLIVVIFGVLLIAIFFKRKKWFEMLFSFSFISNLFCYLYFMGEYRFYPKYFYSGINIYWPWVNVILFAWLAINYIKNKYKK